MKYNKQTTRSVKGEEPTAGQVKGKQRQGQPMRMEVSDLDKRSRLSVQSYGSSGACSARGGTGTCRSRGRESRTHTVVNVKVRQCPVHFS
jgi:hypothetical protein